MVIQLRPEDLPLIMQCIRGDEWPIVSFTITPDLEGDVVTEDSITINCPAGHSYTLRQALQRKLHSRRVADELLEMTREIFPKLKAEHKEQYFEDGRIRWKAKSFPPDPTVIALKLQCIRCEDPATTGFHKIRKETVLCSQCRADWHNENKGRAFSALCGRARGRPGDWWYDTVFYRFVLHLPPFSEEELRIVLERCRAEAKKRKRVDVAFLKNLAQNPSME